MFFYVKVQIATGKTSFESKLTLQILVEIIKSYLVIEDSDLIFDEELISLLTGT